VREAWSAPGGVLARLRMLPRARVALLAASIACLGCLLLYGKFQHWAGDGSFGPRYLVPFLPLAFLAVAIALARAGAMRQGLASVLGVIGLVVQIGGVGIYFGAQMREAGDYPYTLPLDHPRFMSDSHFNPAFSPIEGHWRMLDRNLREHLEGHGPRLVQGGAIDPRVGVSVENQHQLLHALDFWWLYARYAGLPGAPFALAAFALLVASIAAARRALARARAEDA